VPKRWPENPALAIWVTTQRGNKKAGRLSLDRQRRLVELGFVWDRFETTWEEQFAALAQYKAQHGHCNVPHKWPENPVLSEWVSTQRRARRKGSLNTEWQQRLEGLGLLWDLRARPNVMPNWDKSFGKLVSFKAQHGHCNVPRSWAGDDGLGRWVHGQREKHRAGRQSQEHHQRLEGIGFEWRLQQKGLQQKGLQKKWTWDESFAALSQFKAQHGHCNVPNRWAEDPHLGRWVSKQREKQQIGRLSEDRQRRLEALGFEWRLQQKGLQKKWTWDESFAALSQFKAQHGHCNVPQGWAEDPHLGRWVSKQREKQQAGRQSQEHQQRLEALGFEWRLRARRKQTPQSKQPST
jgi:hypothetical protein